MHKDKPQRVDPVQLWTGKYTKEHQLTKAGYTVSKEMQDAFLLRSRVWDFPYQNGVQCTKCSTAATFEHFVTQCQQQYIAEIRQQAISEVRSKESTYEREANRNDSQPDQVPAVPIPNPSQQQRGKPGKGCRKKRQQSKFQLLPPPGTNQSTISPGSKFRTEWLWKGHLPMQLSTTPKDWQTVCKANSKILERASVRISKKVLANIGVWLSGLPQPSLTTAQQRKRLDNSEAKKAKQASQESQRFAQRKAQSVAARTLRMQAQEQQERHDDSKKTGDKPLPAVT